MWHAAGRNMWGLAWWRGVVVGGLLPLLPVPSHSASVGLAAAIHPTSTPPPPPILQIATVITGIQVHNWGHKFDDDSPNLEWVAPTSVYGEPALGVGWGGVGKGECGGRF